jgi:hypothetical protein
MIQERRKREAAQVDVAMGNPKKGKHASPSDNYLIFRIERMFQSYGGPTCHTPYDS